MRAQKTTGLRYWMLQVLEECDHVAADFAADPVHDLRVALRRCRSLADGLMALDPDPNWKAMKKAGRRLFQRLGELRDTQVMMEWVKKLEKKNAADAGLAADSVLMRAAAPEGEGDSATGVEIRADVYGDPVSDALLRILRGREKEQKVDVQKALEGFDRKQWRQWSRILPARAAHIRQGSALFKHLALERWTEARALHIRALRNRSQVTLHSLRMGIKRFRYTVENFLPAEHRAWSNDLKEMQDVLGEIHDLDVFWATAVSCRIFPNLFSRQRWHKRIVAERAKRIERYRARMVGENSLWQVWRAGLPQGKQIREIATRRMKLWAGGLDPDFAHSERVGSLALQLYDGMLKWGWEPAVDAASARASLLAAALLHDVGKTEGQKGHHKTSFDLIRDHGTPLGWSEAEMRRAAIVARFHRGALPTKRHKILRDLLPDEQKDAIQLAAILRLANAMDAAHDGHIRRIQIEDILVLKNGRSGSVVPEALVIAAEGYSSANSTARAIATERHLLEIILRRPVIVRAMKPAGHIHAIAYSISRPGVRSSKAASRAEASK
jgi:CHAD domain-containing protein/HD superfamily phosphodiesterase